MSAETAQTWERMLGRIRRLSATPTVMAALIQALSDPSTTAAQAAEIIASDPALTTKLLQVANSAQYGFAARVSTPSRAVALLGFGEVRALCYALAVASIMPGGRDVPGFAHKEFWRHSLATGLCARSLARRAEIADPEEAFVSGLLHDVAKLAFQQYANVQFAKVVGEALAEGCELRRVERRVLGVDHSRLGRWLADKWSLPAPIVAAIGRHHDPIPGAAYFGAIAVAHAGNAIALMGSYGGSGDPVVPEIHPSVRESLRLRSKDLDLLGQELSADMSRSEELLRALVGPNRGSSRSAGAGRAGT